MDIQFDLSMGFKKKIDLSTGLNLVLFFFNCRMKSNSVMEIEIERNGKMKSNERN